MLYEDDFEFEEQPANLRDRAIPGSRGRGPRNGGGGRGGSRSRRSEGAVELPENAIPARDLLTQLLEKMGVGTVEIAYIPRAEGEYLEIAGPDLAMLIGRHGNTLEALNLIFNNMLNQGVKGPRRYFTIDAEGYRAQRAEQLQELALSTLERVLRDKTPFKLEPMLPSERKIVHMALAEDERVRTESEGQEPERRLVVYPV
jgi:spoIIIJ-associated protein